VAELLLAPRMALLAQPIPEAVAAVVVMVDCRQTLLAAQAAPASSWSNTTSALPQSSPSSHRKSGLHQRARWALTTSLLRGVVEVETIAVAAVAQAVLELAQD
jgi:hypothetical protein